MRDMIKSDGRLGLGNVFLALVLGCLTDAAMMIWNVPGIDPSLWHETVVAAGIRPPNAIFPGFWRLSVGWVFSVCGVEGAKMALATGGAVLGGFCVVLFYLIARQVLALLVRTGRTYASWCNFIAPFFSLVAAFFFGISDPLWRLARILSPEGLRLLGLLLIVHFSLRWFVVGGRWRLFPVWALMGCLAAETPFAFLLPVVFVGAYVKVWHCIVDGLYRKPDRLPEPAEMPKWRMLFLFLGGLAFAVWVNAADFVRLGGLEANGWAASDIYFRYGVGYYRVLLEAGSLTGWMLGICFGVLPLVVAMRVFPLVTNDEEQMPFNYGVIMFFIGAMAVMQCGAFPSARFWTFARDSVLVQSDFLLSFFVFCSMLALALFGASFAFECQRNYLTEEEDPPGLLLKGLVPALALVLMVMAAVGVPKPVETEMQRIVDDAVAEIVRECGDAEWLFTDGRLDAGIEIRAGVEGKTLRTLNMMSGSSEWELNIRRRGFDPSGEDARSVETGVPTLLRVWAGEKPNGLAKAALQLGFEFWKREQRKLPKASGLVARETGMSDEEAAAGVERAQELARRILEISPKIENADPSPALASALSTVNWRLARFARLREDSALADDLDLSNGALKKMLSVIEYERQRTFMQMTPREGLQLALKRADFSEARRYSAAVLRYDEDDPEANFGMGMSALMANRMQEAELYLTRCLKRRPEEPAVLNNLSIICRKARRYQEAESYARRALKLLPDSPEVKQTLADALKKAP